jgi:hypothetical protein
VEDPLGLWYVTAPFSPLSFLELVGLFGLAWYWRTRWWARAIGLLVIGTYLYRWLFVLVFVANGHTMYLHYTSRVIGTALASAGVLSIVAAAPRVARLLSPTWRRAVPIVATAALLAVAALAGVSTWMPWPPGLNDVRRGNPGSPNLAVYAHAEPLPGGTRPHYAPRGVTVAWFPAEPIRRTVEATLGPGARPVTLSYDERLFAYYPWPGYIAVERLASNSWTRWDERKAELKRISQITDPAEFARACAATRFGGIDVFVLRSRPAGWAWGDVTFRSAQFDPARWAVTTGLPNGTVVVVRRPGA